MQVYKAFFKIIKRNLTEITVYIAIFLFFAIVLGNSSPNPMDMNFEETKINIAFINNDEESTLVKGMRSYVKEHANIIEIDNNKEDLQNALFFREVEYIITIPKGFTNNILSSNQDIDLKRNTVPDSVSSIYMDNLINRYLNTVKMYTSSINDISEEDLVKYVDKDLDNSIDVDVVADENGNVVNSNSRNYYNFLVFSIFSILILGVSDVATTFNKKDLRMRNLSSALTLKSMNTQMILGNITFSIGVWCIMIITSFILYGNYMLSVNGLLLILNSLIFTMAALSISLLIGNIVNDKKAMSAAVNVVSLGSCFIGGVFVPQQHLGDVVISIAKFNPTYWYVKANNEISILSNYNKANLEPIFMSMLIVLGFSLAILGITLVVIKQKRIKNY